MLYRPERRRNSILVDLSPLIDVVFLLLIFFMVSTQFKDDHGLDLSLPGAESRTTEKAELLTVAINKEGAVAVDGEQVQMTQLKARIEALLPDYEKKAVVFKVDKSVEHGKVVEAMDLARQAGAEAVTLAGRPKPQSDSQ